MKLTPAILAYCYSLLRETEPFCRWDLPPAEDVRFKVIHRLSHRGSCDRSAGVIKISDRLHGRLSKVLETMAHEMCHMRDTSRAHHGREFKLLAQQVCKHHSDFEYVGF